MGIGSLSLCTNQRTSTPRGRGVFCVYGVVLFPRRNTFQAVGCWFKLLAMFRLMMICLIFINLSQEGLFLFCPEHAFFTPHQSSRSLPFSTTPLPLKCLPAPLVLGKCGPRLQDKIVGLKYVTEYKS